ncbi:density-regulated protein DRP1 [Choiromyces venosus 120613-1]|uniref:Translation machinery-associated protein 22 n=1 Tax=Choiromyces venosus 120613-1 TaxID=1336337 RepID=A0A3N4JDS5_9PEZI|nr:density-regulated protein DRP1 [Choiromyces venosus 120613-1]
MADVPAAAAATAAGEEGAVGPQEPQAKRVLYFCTLPPEYCEFGTTSKKCREWLEINHEELVPIIYNTEAIQSAMQNLSTTAQEKAQKAEAAMAKKALKDEAKQERELAKKLSSSVILKRVERTKRKHVIVIVGLDAFGLDLKKIAKEMGKKFACGASVTKGVGGGGDEIIVQGDLGEEIREWIEERFEEVPSGNVEVVEEKRKKKEVQ